MLGDKVKKWFNITQRDSMLFQDAVDDLNQLIESHENRVELEKRVKTLEEYNESLQATNHREYLYSRSRDKDLKALQANIELFGTHKKCINLNLEYDPYGCIPRCKLKGVSYCKGKCDKFKVEYQDQTKEEE